METEPIPIVDVQDFGNYFDKVVRVFGKVQASQGEPGEIGMNVNGVEITITQENICIPSCDSETLFDITGLVKGENSLDLLSCEQCDFSDKIYEALTTIKKLEEYKEIFESN
ncbi:hypothetical protein ENUP19_0083G0032 [Entamoeba nuttalli]|uniref:Uncharacterized protein n=2 Tax=Entamoeba nuttalli TaxID=412467 RepID=K2I0A0_ENTNP|nr:hypothetical protein ENU1_030560 [Entamoeba nuttalli P19]EKE42155.1 hypothetical protein ENU1_030560 [Entamoeba nuttalli P19]|eukprot:XP_008855510.1 hypothetical protein ENU1_030560 [Entamoeba nuttalli P19]